MLYKNTEGFPREVVMRAASRLHEQGIRQIDIAKAFGCSQGTVSNWLRSERAPIADRWLSQVNDLIASLGDFERPKDPCEESK